MNEVEALPTSEIVEILGRQSLLVYEFGKQRIPNRRELDRYLINVWNDRMAAGWSTENPEAQDEPPARQPFLTFDGDYATAKGYVGLIQCGNLHLEIYPKVFRDQGTVATALMSSHLFYWFDYCRKWKFPFQNVDVKSLPDLPLPELIIYLIADRVYAVILENPLALYEEIEGQVEYVKGRINFNRYTTRSLSTGNYHKLECDYELHQYDNRVNRILKYAMSLLRARAKSKESQGKLDDILFLMDDVETVRRTRSDIDRIVLNPLFAEYEEILNLCKLVLDESIYDSQYSDEPNLNLLLPMEYVFEDFVTGFLERHFSDDWIIQPQRSDLKLTTKAFQMRHDIYLTSKRDKSIQIIVDTKYKLRDVQDQSKKGVSQTDLYQMTSYAFRHGCKNVLMLYPNRNESDLADDVFEIVSGFTDEVITVRAVEIPFWSLNDFSGIETKLKARLAEILESFASPTA
jgi:5-methylcytosine-specific restriction enzyme subunit McrC